MAKHAVAHLPKAMRPAGVKVARAAKRGGSLVAPIGIAGGIITAANAARRQGASIADAALYDGLDTAKSFATYGAAQSAGTYALMRGLGMSAARAAPIANAGLMVYGAAEGAWQKRADGTGAMLKGAARGAWDYSIPGMMLDGAKDIWKGAKEHRQIQAEERARFDAANAHWQRPQAKGHAGYKDQWVDARGRSYTRRDLSVRKGNPDWDIGIDPKRKAEE